MSIERFLNYIRYSSDCPMDVSPARWLGMLKWYVSMLDYEVGMELWAEQHLF